MANTSSTSATAAAGCGTTSHRAPPTPRSSSKSASGGDEDGRDSCVEVATGPGTVHVRDSKQAATGPRLALAPQAWAAFVAGTRT
ncbi:DUF397 domain-containing protein [Streptomyces olivaceus]